MAGRRRKGEPPQMRRLAKRDLAYVFMDGKRHYLGRWNSPEARKRYRLLITEWEAAHRGEAVYRPSGVLVTVRDLVAAFLTHAEVYYRHPDGTPTSQVRTFAWAARDLLDSHADTPAAEFEPADLRALRDRWATARVRGDGQRWTRAAVNVALKKVKAIFDWGAAEGYVPEANAALLAKVKGLPPQRSAAREPGPVRPVPLPLLWRSLGELADAWQTIALVQLRCGCRPGEACRMRGDELFREGTVTVGDETFRVPTWERASKVSGRKRSGRLWAWVPGRQKNAWRGKPVAYLIGPRLQTLLAPLLARYGSGYLFPSPKVAGIPRSMTGYGEATDEAGGWGPGRLRHNFLTSRKRRAGLEAARASVGHVTTVTTRQYVQDDLDDAAPLTARWD
jgi:integrase